MSEQWRSQGAREESHLPLPPPLFLKDKSSSNKMC